MICHVFIRMIRHISAHRIPAGGRFWLAGRAKRRRKACCWAGVSGRARRRRRARCWTAPGLHELAYALLAIDFNVCCHENAVCGKGKLPSWGQLGTQRAFEHAAVPAHDLGLGAATKLPDVFQKSYQRCGRVAWRRDACGPLAVPQTSFSWQKTPKLIAWGRRPDRVSASLQQRVQRFGKFPERPSPRPRCLTCGRVPREGRSRRRRCAGRAGGGAR